MQPFQHRLLARQLPRESGGNVGVEAHQGILVKITHQKHLGHLIPDLCVIGSALEFLGKFDHAPRLLPQDGEPQLQVGAAAAQLLLQVSHHFLP